EMFGEADARETGELANLPMSVEGALGAQPTLSIDPDAPEPTEVVGTVVAEGSGEPVGETGLVVAAYHLATWDGVDGGNTWAQGYPEAVPLGQGTPLDALIGAPVGSRVVIQVPASGTSPAIGTVVEVLGYIPPRDAAVGGPGANSLN
ncbi:MAG: peptidylprolyl isomerase, partial [bacterium]|nr:peptidylprolyl isomerase [bacterium]